MKEVKKAQMLIKMDADLKEAFIKTCKDMDSTASREIRDFMRKYIAKNGQKKLDF